MGLAVISMLVALTGGQPAGEAAGDWQQVAETPRGTVSYDRASLQRAGAILTLLSRTDLAEVQADGTRTIVIRASYDCRRRQSETLSIRTIGEDGATIMSQDVPADQRQMEPIVPDSPDAAIAAAACA